MTQFPGRTVGVALALALGVLAARSSAQEPVAEARALLKTIVEINSTHERGSTTPIARLLAGRFTAAGFPAADVQVLGPGPRKQNLVVRWRAAASTQKPILFISHLDVVEAKREDWATDPFKFVEKDGYYYARGIWDDKAAVTTWVTGLISLRKEGWKPSRDIILILTADEEAGTEDGVEWLLKNHRPLVDAEFAINGDGGGPELHGGKVTVVRVEPAEKNSVFYKFSVTNAGGHSSRPRADNAIYQLSNALARLERYHFPAQLSELQRAGLQKAIETMTPAMVTAARAFLANPSDAAAATTLAADPEFNAMLRTTCVATELTGGHARNALPQLASATVNCRILPGVTPDAMLGQLRTIIADTVVHIGYEQPPRPSADASPIRADYLDPILGAAKAVWGQSVTLQPALSIGASSGIYTRAAGIPTYSVMHIPYDFSDMRAHGRDERISAKAFDESVVFARKLIRAYGDVRLVP